MTSTPDSKKSSLPLKIRVYSPEFPFPPHGGSSQVIFDQIRVLSEIGGTLGFEGAEVELVVWKNSNIQVQESRRKSHVEAFPASVNVRCLGKGAKENVIHRSLRVADALIKRRASSESYYYPLGASTDTRQLNEADIGIYHYSFAHPWLVRRPHKEKKRVVVFHNLESELSTGRAEKAQGPWDAAIHRRNSNILTHHELELLTLSDEVWFISPQDLETFLRRAPAGAANHCKLVPPGFSSAMKQSRNMRFQDHLMHQKSSKRVIGFIGALDFGPNDQSAHWLVDRLAPALQRRGFDGELRIVGRNPSERLRRCAQDFPFVNLTGFLEDPESFWAELSYSLVPHVSGSGVRMKLLESLASGIPTLANEAAAERIHPSLRENQLLVVSDEPEVWASTLLSRAPLEQRRDMMTNALPSALNGNEIYRFLNTWVNS